MEKKERLVRTEEVRAFVSGDVGDANNNRSTRTTEMLAFVTVYIKNKCF